MSEPNNNDTTSPDDLNSVGVFARFLVGVFGDADSIKKARPQFTYA